MISCGYPPFSEFAGFDIAVDERSETVHDKDGEGNAFGICTPLTDDNGDDTNHDTVDDHACVAHGRGDIVSRHEDSAEHQTACEQLDTDIGADAEREDGDCAEDGNGDVPGDYTGAEEVDETDEKRDGSDLTHRTAGETERLCEKVDISTGNLVHLELTEGCGTGGRIKVVETVLHRERPCGHLHGERKEQEHTTDKCGIKNVATETAESHLADTDCNDATDKDCPDRKIRREVEREKKTGKHSRHVADCGTFSKHVARDEIFNGYATDYRRDYYDCCADTEAVERQSDGGKKCNDDMRHQLLHRDRCLRMGRR